MADKLLEMAFEADGVLQAIQPNGWRDGQAYRGIQNKLKINTLI